MNALRKAASELRKAADALARCWEGYESVPGKAPYSEGSCQKKASDTLVHGYDVSRGSDLSDADFSRKVLIDIDFAQSKLDDSNFDSALVKDCVFYGCQFSGATFRNTKFHNVEFHGCHFLFCDFRGSSFKNCRFGYSNVLHADFSGVNLTRVKADNTDFRAAKGDASTQWPKGVIHPLYPK
jgi:uncharacterized protein YjbI with pentapeptide repeats